MSRADNNQKKLLTDIANEIATIATFNLVINADVLPKVQAALRKYLELMEQNKTVEDAVVQLLNTIVTKIGGREEPEKRALKGFCELDDELAQAYPESGTQSSLEAFFVSELSKLLSTGRQNRAEERASLQLANDTNEDSVTRLPAVSSPPVLITVQMSRDGAFVPLPEQTQLETTQSVIRLIVNQEALDPVDEVMRENRSGESILLICRNKSKKDPGIVVFHSDFQQFISQPAEKKAVIQSATVDIGGDECIFSKEVKRAFAYPLRKVVLEWLALVLPANFNSYTQAAAVSTVREHIKAIREKILVPDVMRKLSQTNSTDEAAHIFQEQFNAVSIEKLLADLRTKQSSYEIRIAKKEEYKGIGFFQSKDHSASKKREAIERVIRAAKKLSDTGRVDAAEIAEIKNIPAVKQGELKVLCERLYSAIDARLAETSSPTMRIG